MIYTVNNTICTCKRSKGIYQYTISNMITQHCDAAYSAWRINGFKSIYALKCNAWPASLRLCVEHQRIKGRLLICGTPVHFCRIKRLFYRSWRKRNYIVLLGSLLLCHVFPQGIQDLNLELLVHYRSWPKQTICSPSVCHHVRLFVRPSFRPSVSQFVRFCFCDNF